MATMVETIWTGEPFRMGTPEEFARLCEVLRRHRYTTEGICERLEIGTIYEFKQVGEGRPLVRDVADPQALLLHLFLDTESVPWDTVRTILPAGDITAIEALGLLHSVGEHDERCSATVLLYPTEHMYIVSDRNIDPDSAKVPPPQDVVYPAVTRNTHRFLSVFPRKPTDHFLELCSGTGIAALVAARGFARHAVAVDITERATRFAQFNAALNGIENVTALEGDLYAPVRGQTFDCIVAHPPYMPAFEQQYVFRDGGEDGEQITRRIIAGLADYLRPGGRFYCNCLATDRIDAPLETRVREMLGDSQDEFDVVFALAQGYEPGLYYFNLAREGHGSIALVEQRIALFKRLKVERLVFGTIIVQRRITPRAVFTARRQLGNFTDADEFEWLLKWEEGALDPALPLRLLDAPLRPNPGVQLRMAHVLKDAEWSVANVWVGVKMPFAMDAGCPAWVSALLTNADGKRTGREHLELMKDLKLVPQEASEEEFAGMLMRFVASGVVQTSAFPIPELAV